MKRKGIFRKTLAVALAAAMTLAAAGCGGKTQAPAPQAEERLRRLMPARNLRLQPEQKLRKRERGNHPCDGMGQRKCGSRNHNGE